MVWAIRWKRRATWSYKKMLVYVFIYYNNLFYYITMLIAFSGVFKVNLKIAEM